MSQRATCASNVKRFERADTFSIFVYAKSRIAALLRAEPTWRVAKLLYSSGGQRLADISCKSSMASSLCGDYRISPLRQDTFNHTFVVFCNGDFTLTRASAKNDHGALLMWFKVIAYIFDEIFHFVVEHLRWHLSPTHLRRTRGTDRVTLRVTEQNSFSSADLIMITVGLPILTLHTKRHKGHRKNVLFQIFASFFVLKRG